MEESKLMTAADAATFLCVPRKYIYTLLSRGELECYRVNKKNEIRFSREQLQQYLDSHREMKYVGET